MSAPAPAAAAPTIEQLSALMVALQQEVNALRNTAPTPIVFAETPQTMEVNNPINYATKRGAEIYKQGCAPLNDKSLTKGFNMTPNQTITFVKAFQRHCAKMGWNAGNKSITSFQNKDGNTINIIKATVKSTRLPSRLPANISSRLVRPMPRAGQDRTK
jgi:hypothetical protein